MGFHKNFQIFLYKPNAVPTLESNENRTNIRYILRCHNENFDYYDEVCDTFVQ